MTRSAEEWQASIDAELALVRTVLAIVYNAAPNDAKPTLRELHLIDHVCVDETLGDRGFVYDRPARRLALGVSGLNMMLKAGAERNYYGLGYEEFCRTAVALYLFHELHHVSQGLADFDDVQALKRTAGTIKLGEMDLLADTVAAQVFALVRSGGEDGNRPEYAKYFYQALRFMISFAFPAFGFPLEKRHKVQRALGVVMMAVLTERAIQRMDFESSFDDPIYPYFDEGFGEVIIMSLAGQPSQYVRQVLSCLDPASTRELLGLIDSGNVEELFAKARTFA